MKRNFLLIISCLISLLVFAHSPQDEEDVKLASVNADFTVEYASNLSELDSWSDNSKFQWKAVDHGVIDNGAEMQRLIDVVKDSAPKDTVGFYKQFFDARDNQYIVLRLDKGLGERLFHVRVTNIVSNTDPSQNPSKTYATRDYVYISPVRGEQQLEIKVWPYGQGEEVAKTYTFRGHSYGSRGARSVMLDRSRLVPGKYDLQYVKMDDETAKTDTVTISDLQPGKLYTFYDYLLNPIVEAWLRFDGFKRMKVDVTKWAVDLVTHYDDGTVGVMTGKQMPFLKHKWLEAPNPSYLDTRLFAPHDTLWLNVVREGKIITDSRDLVMNISLVNQDGTAKGTESMPWGQKDDRFFVVCYGEPCAIEAYTKGYAPTITYYRGAYDPSTGWLYDDDEDVVINLSTTRMPESGALVSKMEITSLEAVDEKRDEYYLANILHINLLNEPLTSVVNYDEYGSRKDAKKYVKGVIYDRLAELSVTFTAKNNKMPGDRIYLRKHQGAEENKIKVEKLEGEARKLHYPSFDYAYWDAGFSLLDYLDINDSGRPYLAIDDVSVQTLPILCNLYVDIDEAKKKAEDETKKRIDPPKEGEENGTSFFSSFSDLDLSFKFPMAPPPLYIRAGVNLDFVKKKKISVWGAVGVGIDFDFLDKDGATHKWKEGYNGLNDKGQLGQFDKNKINIRSTDENGLVNDSKWKDLVSKFGGENNDDGPFKITAGAHIEAFQQMSFPLDLKLSDWPGLKFIDEININARAALNASINLSVVDLAGYVAGKVGHGQSAVDWLRTNKYAKTILKALDSGIEFKFNTMLTAKAGIYYFDDGTEEINPLKTHLVAASFLGRIDASARLGLKFDVVAASLEAGLKGVAGVYITGAAGDRLWFDRPFDGVAWSYRAGFGLYYKVHALFWDKRDEVMWGGTLYKDPMLLSNKSNSNPFHKNFKDYMKTGKETKDASKAKRRLSNNYVVNNVDLNYPIRFLSGGDSIIYKSDADSPNSCHLRVVSTGSPAIVSDYLTGGVGGYHSASSANMDVAVFEQATRKLTDTEVAPSDDKLVDCVINNGDISDVYYAVKKAGGKWYRPKPIERNNNTNMKPRVALDDNGHAAAIWQKGRLSKNYRLSAEEQQDITNLIFMGNLVLSRFDGTNWSKPVELVDLDRRLQLSEYQLTVNNGEVFIAATEVLEDHTMKPVFIHVSADDKVTISDAPMEQNNKFELRRVGSHNVVAQLAEVGLEGDKEIRVFLNSYDMQGQADGALSTSLSTDDGYINKFRLVADQNAQSLRNLGLMWVQVKPIADAESTVNLIKAARVVPNGQNMHVGTPLTLAEVADENQIYDFDGYMTDEKINGCYLVNDNTSGAQIQRATAYFSNAFSYSIQFDQDENNAISSSSDDMIQTTFLVTVNNLGTSIINSCVLTVEGIENPIPLHLIVPAGTSLSERVTIPFKSGMAINTTLNVAYDDVLGLQAKQMPRFLARREKRLFARRKGMRYTDKYSNEDVIYEQQTASLYPDVPQLECYAVSQTVDEEGNNKFVIRVKNKFARKMPSAYAVILDVQNEEESELLTEGTPRGIILSQGSATAFQSNEDLLFMRQLGLGIFCQQSNYESDDVILTIPNVTETKSLYVRAIVKAIDNKFNLVTISGGNKNREYAVITVYPSNETTSVNNIYEEGDNQASLHVKVNGNQVDVDGAKPGEDVRLYFSNGMILARQKASSEGKATFNIPPVRRGVYLLSNKKETVKFNF